MYYPVSFLLKYASTIISYVIPTRLDYLPLFAGSYINPNSNPWLFVVDVTVSISISKKRQYRTRCRIDLNWNGIGPSLMSEPLIITKFAFVTLYRQMKFSKKDSLYVYKPVGRFFRGRMRFVCGNGQTEAPLAWASRRVQEHAPLENFENYVVWNYISYVLGQYGNRQLKENLKMWILLKFFSFFFSQRSRIIIDHFQHRDRTNK